MGGMFPNRRCFSVDRTAAATPDLGAWATSLHATENRWLRRGVVVYETLSYEGFPVESCAPLQRSNQRA
jgi:hypothetical protein